MLILIKDREFGLVEGEKGVFRCGGLEKLVVDIKLEHVAHVQPRIALDALAAELDALETDVFLHQRLRQQGNGLGQKAVEPLPASFCVMVNSFMSASETR